MKNITLLSVLLASIGIAHAVPTAINYQGRLTDGDGNPASGSKLFSLSLYDSATAGNELYTETIGSIAVDENGIYNFQFGANGTSTVAEAETLAVADGSSTVYTATPSSTPIAGTLSVSDGTYSWNEVDGNPGELATASAVITSGFVTSANVTSGGDGYTSAPTVTINGDGSGATATATVSGGAITSIAVDSPGSGYTNATVTVAVPPAPFVVDYSAGELTFTYEAAPSAGVEITASYDANDTSIVGALSAADAHWIELSIDGATQSPRERVLSVPFAQVAGVANQVNQTVLDSIGYVKQTPVIESGYLSAYGKPVIESDVTGSYGTTFNYQFSDQIHVPEGQKIVFKNYTGSNEIYNFISAASGFEVSDTIRNYLLIKKAGSTPSDFYSTDTLFTQRLNDGTSLIWDVEFFGPIDVQLQHQVYSSATSAMTQSKFARVGYAVVDAPVIESGYLSAYGKPVIESDVTGGYGTPVNFQFSDQIHVPEGQKIVFKNYTGSNEIYSTYYRRGDGVYIEVSDTIRNDLLIKKAGSTPSDVYSTDTLFTQRLNSGTNLIWDVEFFGPIDVQLQHVVSSLAISDITQSMFARVGYVVMDANFE